MVEYVRMPFMIQCYVCMKIKSQEEFAMKKKNEELYVCKECWEAMCKEGDDE